MAKRGPKLRAGERASARIEVRLTLKEAREIRALAHFNQVSIADLIRVRLLEAADHSGKPIRLALSADLIDRIVAGRKKRAARQLVQE